jgi:hypothetical protein
MAALAIVEDLDAVEGLGRDLSALVKRLPQMRSLASTLEYEISRKAQTESFQNLGTSGCWQLLSVDPSAPIVFSACLIEHIMPVATLSVRLLASGKCRSNLSVLADPALPKR